MALNSLICADVPLRNCSLTPAGEGYPEIVKLLIDNKLI